MLVVVDSCSDLSGVFGSAGNPILIGDAPIHRWFSRCVGETPADMDTIWTQASCEKAKRRQDRHGAFQTPSCKPHTRSGGTLPASTMARRTLTAASRLKPTTKKATSERIAAR